MAKPRRISMLAAMLSLISVLWSGCVTHRDIAADSQYPTDYVLGAVYQTKRALVARRSDSSLFHSRYFFLSPKTWPTPSDVQAQPKKLAEYLIVPAHTDLRIERFDFERNMEAGDYVWIYGKVPGGAVEFNLSFVSREVGRSGLGPTLLMVDSTILERIEAK